MLKPIARFSIFLVHLFAWFSPAFSAYQDAHPIRAIDWNGVSNKIAVGYTDGIVEIIDASPLTVETEFSLESDAGISDLSWNTAGTRLAVANDDGLMRIWDNEQGEFLDWQGGDENVDFQIAIRSLDWCFNDESVAVVRSSISPSQTLVEIYDTLSGELIRSVRISATDDPTEIRCSPTDNRFAVGTYDGLYVYDSSSNERIRFGESYEVFNDLSWSPDGDLVAVGRSEGFTIYNVETGTMDYEVIERAESAITDTADIAFSPNGLQIAVSTDSGRVNVWDIQSQRLVSHYTFEDYHGNLPIAWNGNGDQLAVGIIDPISDMISIFTP